MAESQGFRAAGKVLHRTQSAVSLQIKRLEDQMGQALLVAAPVPSEVVT